MKPTLDPQVFIEEQREGYIRYWRTDGLRWEVCGTCNMCGECLVGAVDPLLGPPEGRLDVPVAPGFECPTLTIKVLRGDSPLS